MTLLTALNFCFCSVIMSLIITIHARPYKSISETSFSTGSYNTNLLTGEDTCEDRATRCSSGFAQKSAFCCNRPRDQGITGHSRVQVRNTPPAVGPSLSFISHLDEVQNHVSVFPIPADYDSKDDDPPPTDPLPPCKDVYDTLEDFDAAVDKIPENCKATYAVDTLSRSLKGALNNYTKMLNDGYDDKFKVYAQSVSDNAGQSVHDFIYQHGNQYFTCVVPETSVCCDYCKDGKNPPEQCNYCFEGNCNVKRETAGIAAGSIHPQDTPDMPMVRLETTNRTEPCPPNYSQRGYGSDSPYIQSVYWTFADGQDGAFYADLLTATAITKDRTKLGNYNRGVDCTPANRLGDGDACWNQGMDFGTPLIDGYSPSDVVNPKELFQNGLKNATEIANQLDSILLDMRIHAYYGSARDLIDSISVPILMVLEATESMKTIDDVADKIEEEKKKAIILGIVSAILFFIPVVGEVAGAVSETATIATMITILGVAGNTAMDVYTIVKDPENAPLAIFSLILEPLALTSIATITRTATIRRGMSDADIGKLGTRMTERMGTLRKITGVCHRI